jgi:hypothetical protein
MIDLRTEEENKVDNERGRTTNQKQIKTQNQNTKQTKTYNHKTNKRKRDWWWSLGEQRKNSAWAIRLSNRIDRIDRSSRNRLRAT